MADNDTQLNTLPQADDEAAVQAGEETVAVTEGAEPAADAAEAFEQTGSAAQDEATPTDTEQEAQELEESANTALEETPADIAQEEEAAEKEAEAEEEVVEEIVDEKPAVDDNPDAKWYVVHTFSGHENRVATTLRQRIESEHLENRIYDILVPTQDKIEIRSGKKETVKEKIFPGYILVKMVLDDQAWLAVRTTQGVTAFVGMNNKPTPIPDREVQSIVKFMTQGAPATFKDVFLVDDTVRIVDGPFTDFIGKVDSVDKEKGKVRVLVSIFGRETPVELDFLQVTKL